MLEIILAILASYRVARMLALEDGPFDLFTKIRNAVDPNQLTWLGRGLNCPLCLGFWISFVIALLVPCATWQGFVLNWLGIAGGMTVVHLGASRWES